jgi:hypothetical protein
MIVEMEVFELNSRDIKKGFLSDLIGTYKGEEFKNDTYISDRQLII